MPKKSTKPTTQDTGKKKSDEPLECKPRHIEDLNLSDFDNKLRRAVNFKPLKKEKRV